jgi:hypothetical protein
VSARTGDDRDGRDGWRPRRRIRGRRCLDTDPAVVGLAFHVERSPGSRRRLTSPCGLRGAVARAQISRPLVRRRAATLGMFHVGRLHQQLVLVEPKQILRLVT